MGLSSSKEGGAAPMMVESKYYDAFEADLPSLAGRTAAITGCTSGTGLVTAKCAARKGADHVILLNRPSDRATQAEAIVKAEIPAGAKTLVETIDCDLQDFDSVKEAAEKIQQKYSKLNVLCCNAGVMALGDIATKDGYDVQMQTNHLSHFLLTKELFPLLLKSSSGDSGPSRVVFHSSVARNGPPLEAKYFEKNGGNLGGDADGGFGFVSIIGPKWDRYHQTKLANAVMTTALADKLQKSGLTDNVIVACAAPGAAATSLLDTSETTEGIMTGLIRKIMQSSEDGSMPLLTACFGPNVANGDFYEPDSAVGMYGKAIKKDLDKKNCHNPEQQKLLWETSEAACGKFEV